MQSTPKANHHHSSLRLTPIGLLVLFISFFYTVEAQSCVPPPANCALSCFNGGTCFNRTHCCCAPGFSGARCNVQAVPCASGPCQQGGTCNDFTTYYKCSCATGTTGTNCESGSPLAASPCTASNTCAGHYVCNNAGARVCAAGFSGSDCTTYTAPSGNKDPNCPDNRSGACLHGGTCFNGGCCCPLGFSGPRCNIQSNPCSSQPCQNGGVCNSYPTAYTCLCAQGFTGINCQLSICGSKPTDTCLGHYTCSNNVFTCLAGWTNPNSSPPCITPANANDNSACPATLRSCLNGGTCFNGGCCCLPCFTGEFCQTRKFFCSPNNPCLNGGSCYEAPPCNYACLCPPGFNSTKCATYTGSTGNTVQQNQVIFD